VRRMRRGEVHDTRRLRAVRPGDARGQQRGSEATVSAVPKLTEAENVALRASSREALKSRYQKARDAARARFGQSTEITVPETATVMLCPDGAYVEAMVWVGEDELR
jgi:hypothetical protein